MVELGIYGASRSGYPIQEPKITHKVCYSLAEIREERADMHITWKAQWFVTDGQPSDKVYPATNLTWVASRFDLFEQNRNEKWEYGPYLGLEEMFHPVVQTEWYPTVYPFSSWTLDGEYTKYGITVKALRPWYIQTYGAWDQTWWNNVNVYDQKLVTWSKYYGRKLYEMWHLHMHALGKKSTIIGYTGIPSDMNGASDKYINWLWGTDLNNYIMNNYDSIYAYQYPICISGCARPIQWSIDAAMKLKSTFKGKFVWILTALWVDGMGTADKTIEFEEYKAMLPYANVIFLPEFTNMKVGYYPGSDPGIPKLVEFCTSTGSCGTSNCPPLQCKIQI